MLVLGRAGNAGERILVDIHILSRGIAAGKRILVGLSRVIVIGRDAVDTLG